MGVFYLVLLLWAAISDGGVGSPIVFPFLVLLALALGTGLGLVVFLPTTLISEWICRRYEWYFLYEIPIASFVLVLGLVTVSGVIALMRSWSIGVTLWFAAAMSLVLLFPLGVYWWCLQSTAWILGLAERAVASWQGASAGGGDL
jgi:hypothetical protein